MLAEVHCTLNVPSRSPTLLHNFSFQTHIAFRVVSRLDLQRPPLPAEAPSKESSVEAVSTLTDRPLHTCQFGHLPRQTSSFTSGLPGAFNSLRKLTGYTPQNTHHVCVLSTTRQTLLAEYPLGRLSQKTHLGTTEPAPSLISGLIPFYLMPGSHRATLYLGPCNCCGMPPTVSSGVTSGSLA